MNRLVSKAVVFVSSVALVTGMAIALPAAVAAADTAQSDRIAGSNRYETSALIAARFGTAGAIVIANGETAKDGADALAANYLAASVGAPILLVRSDSVSDDVLAAIRTVLAGADNPTIYIMGGGDSVSAGVLRRIHEAAASVAGGTVTDTRVAGKDRYETAAQAATLPDDGPGDFRFASSGTLGATAILASGQVNADALAAGPVSYAWGLPVLLTPAGQLPSAVADAIRALGITNLLVLGGTDRISEAVVNQARAAGAATAHRIFGPNRFATAALLFDFVMDTMVDARGRHYLQGDNTVVFLANGLTGFPDALSVGPLAGQSHSVLLTVPAGSLPSAVAEFLRTHGGMLGGITMLGAPSTIADAVGSDATAARDGSSSSGSGSESSGGSGAAGTGGSGSEGSGSGSGSGTGPQPTLISPNHGSVLGGHAVTIAGNDLAAASAVTFGETRVTDFISANDTSITLIAPPGYPEVVDVRVTTPRGTSSASVRYTFDLPTDALTMTSTPKDDVVTGDEAAIDEISADVPPPPMDATDPEPDPATYSLTLATGATPPIVGEIYYLPPGADAFPSGLVGRVTAVTTDGAGRPVVTVEQVPFDEAFERLVVEYNGLLGTDDPAPGLRSGIGHAFNAAGEGGMGQDLTGKFKFNKIPGTFFTCTDNISIDGSFNIELQNVHNTFELITGSLVESPSLTSLVSYEVVVTGSVALGGATTCELSDDMQITVPVANTGLTVGFAPKIEVTASGAGAIKFTQRTFRTDGVVSQPDGHLKQIKIAHQNDPEFEASGKLKFELGVGLAIEFGVLDTIGIGIDTRIVADIDMELTVTAPQKLCSSIGVALEAKGYGFLKLWKVVEFEYDFLKVTVHLADFGPYCVLLSNAMPPTLPPDITTAGHQYIELGHASTIALATDDARSGTWSYSGDMPPGLALSGTKITGTPTAKGNYAIDVILKTTDGHTVTKPVVVSVAVADLVIGTASLPQAAFGHSYSTQLTVSGGEAPYAWTVSAGSLPDGLTLGATTGLIAGSPVDTDGGGTFTVRVTDSSGSFATRNFTIEMDTTPGSIGGAISSGGSAVAGVLVKIYPTQSVADAQAGSWSYLGASKSATTDSAGKYVMDDVPVGTYVVCFDALHATGAAPAGYFDDCYDGAAWAGGDSVPPRKAATVVVPSGERSTVNGVLRPAAGFEGHVTDAYDAGLTNVDAVLFNRSGTSIPAGRTDSHGYYKVTRLAAGDYDLCFAAGEHTSGGFGQVGYASQCAADAVSIWRGDGAPSEESVRKATNLGALSTVDQTLTAYWKISGRVVDGNGTAIKDAHVSVMSASGQGGVTLSASTDASGDFGYRGLAPGSYFVCVRPSSATADLSGYVGVCAPDIPWSGLDRPIGAVAVVVDGGADFAANGGSPIVVQTIEGGSGGAVMGHVSDSAGAPLKSVHVRVIDDNGSYIATSTTKADGSYTVSNVPAGNYAVCFDGSAAGTAATGYASACADGVEMYYGTPDFTPLTVTDGELSARDMSLPLAAGIGGTVTNADGDSVLGVTVFALPVDAGPWEEARLASTDYAGKYVIRGLDTGQYEVCFRPPAGGSFGDGYLPKCHADVAWDGDEFDWPSGLASVSTTAGSVTAGIDVTLAKAGVVQGTVTDAAGGAALQGVEVLLISAQDDSRNYLTTDHDGNYRINSVADGQYTLCFAGAKAHRSDDTASGYVNRCLGDVLWIPYRYEQPDNATEFTVAAGVVLTKNISLARGGSISGSLTDDAGGTLSDVRVFAYSEAARETVAMVESGVDGKYLIAGLDSGSYLLCFDATSAIGAAGTGGYTNECYDGRPWDGIVGSMGSVDADPITVTGSASVTGINASLGYGGAIAGTVTGRDGTGLYYVGVTVYDAVGMQQGYARTNGDGQYLIDGLPTGDYRVCFNGSYIYDAATPDGYGVQCHGGVPGSWSPDSSGATPVTVTAGSTTAVDAAMIANWTIDLLVTDPDGAPVAGTEVLLRTDIDWIREDTGSDGHVRLAALSNREVRICATGMPGSGDVADTAGTCWDGVSWDLRSAVERQSPAIPIELSEAREMTLRMLPGGTIAGSVTGTDPDGGSTPVAVGGVGIDVFDSGWRQVGTAVTGADGTYRLSAPVGDDMRLCFGTDAPISDVDYASECWDDVAWDGFGEQFSATPVEVTANSLRGDIDAHLQLGGRIDVAVTGAGGSVLGAQISLYSAAGAYLRSEATGVGNTATFRGVTPGTYRICVNPGYASVPDGTFGGYQSTCVHGVDGVIGGGDLVEVVAGGSVEVTRDLQPGGAISGRVTSAGQPAQGVRVEIRAVGGSVPVVYTSTGADGTYVALGLEAGSYSVCFVREYGSSGPGAFVGECYDDVPYSGGGSAAAGFTPVSVAVGSVASGIDADLAVASTISGRVLLPDGGPATFVARVNGRSASGNSSAEVGADGRYTIQVEPGQPYWLCVEDLRGWAAQYVTTCWSSEVPAGEPAYQVDAGQDLPNVDLSFTRRGGLVGGTAVVDVNSAARVVVTAFGATDADRYGAVTRADGSYVLGPLPEGSYAICFAVVGSLSPNYQQECFDDVPSDTGSPLPAGVESIPVTIGSTRFDIDAVLVSK